jgi:squalene monooxygenase
MTVALNDVVMLRTLLQELPESDGFRDWEKVREVLEKWHWRRKPLASTINILSIALYDLFGADGGFFQVFFSSERRD